MSGVAGLTYGLTHSGCGLGPLYRDSYRESGQWGARKLQKQTNPNEQSISFVFISYAKPLEISGNLSRLSHKAKGNGLLLGFIFFCSLMIRASKWPYLQL